MLPTVYILNRNISILFRDCGVIEEIFLHFYTELSEQILM